MTSETVYVLGTPGSGVVKIGRTINLAKRFAEIQRMSPVPLTILWSHPGGAELETQLHRQFSALRTHGEWFSFSNDPVVMVQWAVSTQPWARAKVKLKKPRPKKQVREKPAAVRAKRPPVELHPIIAEALEDLRKALVAIPDPLARYEEVLKTEEELRLALRQRSQAIVQSLKAEGLSWREVGERLDVSGQRAHQIANGTR